MRTNLIRKPWFIALSVGLLGIAWLVASRIWAIYMPYPESEARMLATKAFGEVCVSQKIDCAQFDGPFPTPTAHPTLAYRWVLRDDPGIDIFVHVNRRMGAHLSLDPELHKIPRVGAPPFPNPKDIPKG